MTFRDYRPADFERLCEIDRCCFEPRVAYSAGEMRAILRHRRAVVIVAENSRGEVVAFVAAQRRAAGRARDGTGDAAWIVTLDVLPRYRRRGVGRELMRRSEERLAAAGVRVAVLETAVSNRAAQALYESLGYTFVKRLPRYYASGEDGWRMEKRLVRA
ncbi:MAG TPA: N-acetyltransferase [Bryobacterales bacterium]|nr:N-acetyltransferase [Bryobacterales bacterium]